MLSAGDVIAVAPQELAEFIHVVTDPRRFTQPLDMTAARHVAEHWWTASKDCARSLSLKASFYLNSIGERIHREHD